MSARSSRADVRNPMMGLPSVQRLRDLPPEARAALRAVLQEISTDSRARGNECWRRHKAPMAAYWKAKAVDFRHLALLLRDAPRDGKAARALASRWPALAAGAAHRLEMIHDA